jgi:glycosyl transferase, family 25
MIPTYVISLPEASERRASAERQLSAAGVDWRFIDAIKGRALARDSAGLAIGTTFLWRFNRYVVPGEIGCSLSHMAALLAFLSTGAPRALILEDDFSAGPEAWASLRLLLDANLPHDILKLGGATPPNGRVVRHVAGLDVIETLKPSICAHAYVVSQAGAQKLVCGDGATRIPFDNYLLDTYLHGAVVAEAYPFPFGLSSLSLQSSLAADRSGPEGSSSILRPVAWFRKAKGRLPHNIRKRLYARRMGGQRTTAL